MISGSAFVHALQTITHVFSVYVGSYRKQWDRITQSFGLGDDGKVKVRAA